MSIKVACMSIVVSLIMSACNEKSGSETKMEELQDILSQIKKEQCKVKLNQPLINNDSIGIEERTELKSKCDSIMQHIGQGAIKKGFEEIKKYTWISDKEIDIVKKGTIQQLDLVGKRYGDFIGYEFIKQKTISNSIIEFTYLAKCKNHPLVWRFIFYKAEKKWTLNVFNWHDKIQNLK